HGEDLFGRKRPSTHRPRHCDASKVEAVPGGERCLLSNLGTCRLEGGEKKFSTTKSLVKRVLRSQAVECRHSKSQISKIAFFTQKPEKSAKSGENSRKFENFDSKENFV